MTARGVKPRFSASERFIKTNAAAAVGNRRRVRRRHRAVFAECRAERRDFFDVGLVRLLVARHRDVAFTGRYRDRFDLGFKGAVINRFLGTGQTFDGKCVLLFAGELVMLRSVFGEGAHETAFVIGIFESIQEHVIFDLIAMPQTIALTGTEQDVWCIGHALHAACDHHVVRTGKDVVMRQHGRLHR